MGFFDFGTIFFLVAAVVIFFQLRNVLGRRTGNERPPFDPVYRWPRQEGRCRGKPENVVSLPRKRAAGEPAEDIYTAIDAFAKPGTRPEQGPARDQGRRSELRAEDLRRRRQDGL